VREAEKAGSKITTGVHDTVRVKGRLEPVEVFEIIDVVL